MAAAALVTEAEFQSTVIDLAETFGWTVYHTHDSRRSREGFPDLIMVRGAREIAAELKTEKGQPTPEQAEWLELFEAVPGVESYLWRPSDLEQIQRILEGGHV